MHAYQAAAGLPYLYLYLRGAGVQGILYEFLEHGGGALYDLASGYLGDDFFGKDFYFRHKLILQYFN